MGPYSIFGQSMTESMARKLYKELFRGSLPIAQNLFSYFQSYFFKTIMHFPLETKGKTALYLHIKDRILYLHMKIQKEDFVSSYDMSSLFAQRLNYSTKRTSQTIETCRDHLPYPSHLTVCMHSDQDIVYVMPTSYYFCQFYFVIIIFLLMHF